MRPVPITLIQRIVVFLRWNDTIETIPDKVVPELEFACWLSVCFSEKRMRVIHAGVYQTDLDALAKEREGVQSIYTLGSVVVSEEGSTGGTRTMRRCVAIESEGTEGSSGAWGMTLYKGLSE
jgi:hypothetical protein